MPRILPWAVEDRLRLMRAQQGIERTAREEEARRSIVTPDFLARNILPAAPAPLPPSLAPVPSPGLPSFEQRLRTPTAPVAFTPAELQMRAQAGRTGFGQAIAPFLTPLVPERALERIGQVPGVGPFAQRLTEIGTMPVTLAAAPFAPLLTAGGVAGAAVTGELARAAGAPPWAQTLAELPGGLVGGFGARPLARAGIGALERTAPGARASLRLRGVPAAVGAAEQPPVVQKLIRVMSGPLKEVEPPHAALLAERGRRIAGAVGAIQERPGLTAQQRLAMSRAAERGPIQAEIELSEAFTAVEVEELGQMIAQSPALRALEKPNAQAALFKLLAIPGEDVLPETALARYLSPSEKRLLDKAFSGLGAALPTKPGEWRLWREALDVLNLPRAVLASVDFSFPLRQGAMLITRPGWWKAWKPMVRSFGDAKVADDALRSIVEHPKWEIARRSGLAIADPKTGRRAAMSLPVEEAFVSQWSGKIPLIKHSQRAYTTAGNKIRGDTFYDTLAKWDRLGVKYTLDDTKALARWINIASGWGELGPLEKALPQLVTVLFSPRYWASRLQALPVGIQTMATNPLLRREVARDLLGFAGMNAGLLGLMGAFGKASGKLSVEYDPRSTDFGRIKIGLTRIDTLAGFQPMIRTAAQFIFSEGKSPVTGEFYKRDQLETIARHVQGKLSPAASFVIDALRGYTFIGEPMELTGEATRAQFWNRLAPMFIQDMRDAIREQGPKGALMAAPAAFGATVLTYETAFEELRGAQDAASKELYDKGFEELVAEGAEGVSPGTQSASAAVAGHQAVQAAEVEVQKSRERYGGGGERRSLVAQIEPFTVQQEQIDTQFPDNAEWREQSRELRSNMAGAIAQYYSQNPEIAARARAEREEIGDPFSLPADIDADGLRAAYLKVFSLYSDEATGFVLDKEALFRDIDRFMAQLSDEQQLTLEANVGTRSTPRQKEYRVAAKGIADSGWWDLQDSQWQEFARQSNLRPELLNASYEQILRWAEDFVREGGEMPTTEAMHRRVPLLAAFDRMHGKERLFWRAEHPEIDALLVIWGYASVPRTPQAAAIVKEETGLDVRPQPP